MTDRQVKPHKPAVHRRADFSPEYIDSFIWQKLREKAKRFIIPEYAFPVQRPNSRSHHYTKWLVYGLGYAFESRDFYRPNSGSPKQNL
jgi:hypothetical protein